MNNFEKSLANRLLEMDMVDYISTTPEKVMSGATRAFRKGARKAKTTGVGNDLENRILTVPRTYTAIRRRARKARDRGHVRKAVDAAFREKA